ncbi:unnamed protein product, partial [Choristocarpus tenellus]
TYTVGVHTTLLQHPSPGNNGHLSATMTVAGIAEVTMDTTDMASISISRGVSNVAYRLYWSTLPIWEGDVEPQRCVMLPNGNLLMDNPKCIFWTACGAELAAETRSEWEVLPPNQRHKFEVPVDNDMTYLFNVAMRDGNNVTSMYSATNMSVAFITYQNCVSDASCESQ